MDLGPHSQTEHAPVIRTPLLGQVEERTVNLADTGRTPGHSGEFDKLVEAAAEARIETRVQHDRGRGFARNHVVRRVVPVGRQPDHRAGRHHGLAHDRQIILRRTA